MDYSWPSLCLNVRDLDESARFYEALGMQVLTDLSVRDRRVVLRSGGFRIGLFRGIGENCLNLRGADVVAAHEELKRRFPTLEGAPHRYTADGGNGADFDGCSWLTRDPDRNAIFFDTNANEEGEPFRRRRMRQILSDAEHELTRIGASAECLAVLRTQLIDVFCGA